MNQVISRRRFLQTSAITIGSGIVFTFSAIAHARPLITPTRPITDKDIIMPHVSVKLYPGRSEQQKAQLAEAIVQDLINVIQCSIDSISIAIEDIDPKDWKDKVYTPEVLAKPDNLYKKPGYSM